jgi:DNA primase
MHSDNIVQLVKEAADIAEVVGELVSLKRSGTNLKGLCPFHSEKTPSFMVNPERRSFHCFGCGEGGDVFSFLMKYHNQTFPETLKELAHKYNIPLPEKSASPEEQAQAKKREGLYQANEKAAALFHEYLLHNKNAEPARIYLQERGIPLKAIQDYQLGYAPDSWDFLCNSFQKSGVELETAYQAGLIVQKEKGGYYDRFRKRILFPISNAWGKKVAFGGRILGEGQPKYLNSPETPVFEKSSTLFGFYQNKEFIREKKQCIVVEGNFDLLSLVANGIKNVAAPLGTALTKQHVRTLKGYTDEIILLFDGDTAGMNAAMRTVPIFLTDRINGKIAILADNHDPDTFIRENGADELLKLIDSALSLPEFVFGNLVKQYGLSLEGKSRIVSELRPIMESIDDQAQLHLFASHFGAKLGLTPEKLLFAEHPSTRSIASLKTNAPSQKGQLPFKQRQLLEFLLSYPEYLPSFLDAGLEDVIDSMSGIAILQYMKTFCDENVGAGPEEILSHASGSEKTIISEMLISAPSYDDEEMKAIGEERLTWLKKNSFKEKMGKLTMQINEAQQANDESLCMELVARKIEMEKTLSS